MAIGEVLKGFLIGVVLIIFVTVFISQFGSVKQSTIANFEFEKASLGVKNDYCNYAYGINYSYAPAFENTNKYCSATYNSITGTWSGSNLVNDTAYQLWINSPENQIITQEGAESILDPILFGGIFGLMLFSLWGVLFSEKITSLKIFIFVLPGIPLLMVGIWIFASLLQWLLFEVMPNIFSNFDPNFPLFFWQLDNMGVLTLIYLCAYALCLMLEIETIKEQAVQLVRQANE